MAAIAGIFGSFIQGGFSALNESVATANARKLQTQALISGTETATADATRNQEYLTLALVAIAIFLTVKFFKDEATK